MPPALDAPTVAIVVPVRNESRHIDDCLAALTGQTYPHDRLQIVVVDGESSDDTVERVRRWKTRDGRIRLLNNPARVMPVGLNLGIEATDCDIVGVMSGHSSFDHDYVERTVRALRETGAWCVGARVSRESSSPVQRAIARAATSPIGVGDSRHNYATESGWAETAFPGMWPRWVFERIGLFDVDMPYNEDNEFSYRIIAAGGRIWFESSIIVRYVPRASLSGLFAQYRRYGRGKIAVFRKHRGAVRWRHFVPPVWVAWLSAAAVGGLVNPVIWILGALTMAVYLALTGSAALRHRRPDDPVALTIAAFAAMHVGYGLGIWGGLLDAARGR